MKNNLMLVRKFQNTTQKELAQELGVSRQTIISIESNKYIPSTLLSLKIAGFFNKTVEEIFQLEDNDY